MKFLGIDLGTTTVSAAVMENGRLLRTLTTEHNAFCAGTAPWERIQDPCRLRDIALVSVLTLFAEFPDIAAIGVTGQMHGIVYLNAAGVPVSPLYTWQDGRGDLPYDDTHTYAAYLSEITGYPMASGYGLVTHFWLLQNRAVPKGAAVFCTVQDYLAMVLAGRTSPIIDASNAASLGMYNTAARCFDSDAVRRAGLDGALLPAASDGGVIGYYRGDVPVYAAIGDNQASFLGAVGEDLHGMLVNVGTGSQFSVYSDRYLSCEGLETRPFPGGGYLLVGASLCGGRAYALLERFFRMTAEMLGYETASCYDAMEALVSRAEGPEDMLRVTPLFDGTRQNPDLRGSITGISTENLTPLHLIWGTMEGMAEELHGMYRCYLAAGGTAMPLIGSGNGLRRNHALRVCFAEKFGTELVMSDCEEEAAVGAARYAARLYANQSADS